MKLIPYTKIDGRRNFKDSEIIALYRQMAEEKTLNTVLSDGTIQNEQQFLSSMKTSCQLFVILDEPLGEISTPIAITWLNRLEGKTARLHFCFFKKAWGVKSVKVGKFICRQILDFTYGKGYLYDSLIGRIPVSNKSAIEFFKKIGVKFVGELPEGHWNHFKQQSESALVVYMNRGCLDAEKNLY